MHNRYRSVLAMVAGLAAAGGFLVGPTATATGQVLTTPRVAAGAAAPVRPDPVCGTRQLQGPSVPPRGAVVVPAGDDSSLTLNAPATTYWFAPGVHTIGSSASSQIRPSSGDTYIGGPGAVLSGQNIDNFAFVGSSSPLTVDVTIEYLTVEGFTPIFNNGAVNQNSNPDWTFKYDTITDNSPGAGVVLGTNNLIAHSCLSDNGQYGFNASSGLDVSPVTDGPSNIVMVDNEIAGNNTEHTNVGAEGGGKFWHVDGATVIGNYVHGNDGPGLWIDTDNTGFNISHNYISDNTSEGVAYEISYNARIADNTFVGNGVVDGPTNPSFPTPAIYLYDSGSDQRVPGPYGSSFQVTGNVMENNYAGVVAFDLTDRFCGDVYGDPCTLVDPSAVTLSTCVQANLQGTSPGNVYYDNCRWHPWHISVNHNVFSFDPTVVGASCTSANSCGQMGLFASEASSPPSWLPWTDAAIQNDIVSRSWDNRWYDNVYRGPWTFMVHAQGQVVDPAVWQQQFGQDHGSIFLP